MDDRLKIDERIAKEDGILSENETLKTDIKTIAKDNKKLEKQIKDMQKIQLELLNKAEETSKVIDNTMTDDLTESGEKLDSGLEEVHPHSGKKD